MMFTLRNGTSNSGSRWDDIDDEDPLFWVAGGGGTGKSVVSAEILR